MPTRKRRVTIAVAVAILAGTAQAPSGSAATGCAGVKHSGHWDTISLPASSSYTPPATTPRQTDTSTYPVVAVSRRTGDITATDAARTSLWHSADGGCTWHSAFALSGVPGADGGWLANLGYQFSSLAVADGTSGRPVLYAAAVPYSGAGQDAAIAANYGSFGFAPDGTTLRLFVFVSRDGGTTWKQTYVDATPADIESDALHPVCMNGSVAVTLGQPSTVYVDCQRDTGDPTSVLYTSSDSAAHWTTPTAKDMPGTPYMPASGFTAEPGTGSTLWMPGNITATGKKVAPKEYVTIYRSRDRGVSWQSTSLRADKVCDPNTTGWVVSTATSMTRVKVVTMWSPAALMNSTNGGATWTRAIPFTGDTADYEGAAVTGPHDTTTYAIGAWPSRSNDWGTNFRPWAKDLRTRHVLFALGPRGTWHTIGTVPAPVNSALYEVQAGWWQGGAVYGVAVAQSSSNAAGFSATLLRYRP